MRVNRSSDQRLTRRMGRNITKLTRSNRPPLIFARGKVPNRKAIPEQKITFLGHAMGTRETAPVIPSIMMNRSHQLRAGFSTTVSPSTEDGMGRPRTQGTLSHGEPFYACN